MSAQRSMPRCGTGIFGWGWLSAAGMILLVALLLPGLAAAIPTAERDALIDLYNSTNGAGWTNKTNWNGLADTECTWLGVTCGAGQHVTDISLTANNLTGTLPASLNDLTELRTLSVADNHLTGSIPSLSSLINLERFNASNNQLSGPIPSLYTLTKLEYFFVYSNQLSGSIPSLFGLTLLKTFDVSFNQLSGPAPLVPNPSSLSAGDSALCPNFLSPWTGTANDLAWDAATGSTPWSKDCTANNAGGTAAIPTLSEWGLLLLASLLGLMGLRHSHRHV